jgi:hypothetical protein
MCAKQRRRRAIENASSLRSGGRKRRGSCSATFAGLGFELSVYSLKRWALLCDQGGEIRDAQ